MNLIKAKEKFKLARRFQQNAARTHNGKSDRQAQVGEGRTRGDRMGRLQRDGRQIPGKQAAVYDDGHSPRRADHTSRLSHFQILLTRRLGQPKRTDRMSQWGRRRD